MALDVYGRYPTVPEYFGALIRPGVDLARDPKQCCPFHQEDTPSFSYDYRTGRWSCFGACHAHGDVIDMHQRFYKFRTREQAEIDLARRCGVNRVEVKVEKPEDVYISENKVELKKSFLLANALANTTERMVELDEVMSKYPTPENELYNLYVKWSTK